MSFNVLDTVKGLFTNDLVSKAASSLGESESSISSAISGAVPSVLGGLISKVSSGEQGASSIFQLAKSAAGSGILGNLDNVFSGSSNLLSSGTDMLKSIFGDKLSSITNAIAGQAGISQSSSASLMSMVAPAALGAIGQHAQQNNLGASSVGQMLLSQKSSILNAMPSGLGSKLTDLLGLGSIGAAVSSMSHKASATVHAAEAEVEKSGGMKFLLPLLLAILAILLLLYFFKGCNGADKPAPVADTVQKHIDTVAAAPTGPVSIKVKLPNGVELDAYKGGIEDQLVTFLQTDYAKLGEDSLKKTWFDFDNLNFKTGSAEITPESQHQIDNISAILKAFPKSKIKIGGYTDKTGNEDANKKLSKERAEAVSAALGKAGVGAQVTGADGYGSEYAKFAADAPESDRVKDRHVSVSVRL